MKTFIILKRTKPGQTVTLNLRRLINFSLWVVMYIATWPYQFWIFQITHICLVCFRTLSQTWRRVGLSCLIPPPLHSGIHPLIFLSVNLSLSLFIVLVGWFYILYCYIYSIKYYHCYCIIFLHKEKLSALLFLNRKYEWHKHGTCAAKAESLNSQHKYFSKALELYHKLDLDRYSARTHTHTSHFIIACSSPAYCNYSVTLD